MSAHDHHHDGGHVQRGGSRPRQPGRPGAREAHGTTATLTMPWVHRAVSALLLKRLALPEQASRRVQPATEKEPA